MHIANYFAAAAHRRSGIANNAHSLMDASIAQDSNNQYTLLTSKRPSREYLYPQADHVRFSHILPWIQSSKMEQQTLMTGFKLNESWH